MARHYKNLIDGMLEFLADSDVSALHKKWAAATVISATVNRKVWLANATFTVYPNLYTFLIGEAGTGKSTMAGNLVNNLAGQVPGLYRLPGSVTEASFLEQLSGIGKLNKFEWAGEVYPNCSGFYYADEAANGLKEMHQNGSLLPVLTELFNCGDGFWRMAPSFIRRTVAKGEVRITNPCVVMLLNSTPQWLKSRAVSKDDLEGGFGSRCVFVCDPDFLPADFGWQKLTGGHKVAEKRLVEDLIEISKIQGPFEVTKQWEAFYSECRKETFEKRKGHSELMMRNFYTRKETQALKLAMIFSLAESRDMVIDERHQRQAWEWLGELEPKIEKTFGRQPAKEATSSSNRSARMLMQYLEVKADGALIPRSEMAMFLFKKGLDKNGVNGAIDFLRDVGFLAMALIPGQKSPHYRISKDQKP